MRQAKKTSWFRLDFTAPSRSPCVLWPLLFVPRPQGLALLLRNCASGDTDLVCRLNSVLNLLYGIAIFLGLVLLVALWAAVRTYRRNREDRGTRR